MSEMTASSDLCASSSLSTPASTTVTSKMPSSSSAIVVKEMSQTELNEKRLTCTTCSLEMDMASFFTHNKEEHGNFACLYCLKFHKFAKELMVHLHKDHRAPPQKFSNEIEFLEKGGHGTTLLCVECNKTFISDTLTSDTMKSHLQECVKSTGICPKCGSILLLSLLGNHIASCKGLKNMNLAESTTITTSQLRNRDNSCKYCGKKFSPSKIAAHRRACFGRSTKTAVENQYINDNGPTTSSIITETRVQENSHSSNEIYPLSIQKSLNDKSKENLKIPSAKNTPLKAGGRQISNKKSPPVALSQIRRPEFKGGDKMPHFIPKQYEPMSTSLIKYSEKYDNRFMVAAEEEDEELEEEEEEEEEEEMEEEPPQQPLEPLLVETDPQKRILILLEELAEKLEGADQFIQPSDQGEYYSPEFEKGHLIIDSNFDEKDDNFLLTEMLSKTFDNCVYCKQVKIIRLDKRQLAIHLLKKHRWEIKILPKKIIEETLANSTSTSANSSITDSTTTTTSNTTSDSNTSSDSIKMEQDNEQPESNMKIENVDDFSKTMDEFTNNDVLKLSESIKEDISSIEKPKMESSLIVFSNNLDHADENNKGENQETDDQKNEKIGKLEDPLLTLCDKVDDNILTVVNKYPEDNTLITLSWKEFKLTVLKKVFFSEKITYNYLGQNNIVVVDKEQFRLGDIPCECLHCGFNVDTQRNLFLHWRRFHKGVAMTCIMCHGRFLFAGALFSHLCFGVSPHTIVNFPNRPSIQKSIENSNMSISDLGSGEGGEGTTIDGVIKEKELAPDTNLLRYQCGICEDLELPGFFNYMVHLRKDHRMCELCLETLGTELELEHHLKKHKLNHFCWKCGVTYCAKPNFMTHLFWKHGTESLDCSKCLKKKWPHIYHFCFPSVFFKCDTCGLIFTKAKSLIVHKRIHTGEKLRRCPKHSCQERFISKKLLQKHLDIYHNPNVPPPPPPEEPTPETPETTENSFNNSSTTETEDQQQQQQISSIPSPNESDAIPSDPQPQPISQVDDDGAILSGEVREKHLNISSIHDLFSNDDDDTSTPKHSPEKSTLQDEEDKMDTTPTSQYTTPTENNDSPPLENNSLNDSIGSQSSEEDFSPLHPVYSSCPVEAPQVSQNSQESENINAATMTIPPLSLNFRGPNLSEDEDESDLENDESKIERKKIKPIIISFDLDNSTSSTPGHKIIMNENNMYDSNEDSMESIEEDSASAASKDGEDTEDTEEEKEKVKDKTELIESQSNSEKNSTMPPAAEKSKNNLDKFAEFVIAAKFDKIENDIIKKINGQVSNDLLLSSDDEEGDDDHVKNEQEKKQVHNEENENDQIFSKKVVDDLKALVESNASNKTLGISQISQVNINLNDNDLFKASKDFLNSDLTRFSSILDDDDDEDLSPLVSTLSKEEEKELDDFGSMSPLLPPLDADFGLPDIPTFEENTLPEHILRENAIFSINNEHDYCKRRFPISVTPEFVRIRVQQPLSLSPNDTNNSITPEKKKKTKKNKKLKEKKPKNKKSEKKRKRRPSTSCSCTSTSGASDSSDSEEKKLMDKFSNRPLPPSHPKPVNIIPLIPPLQIKKRALTKKKLLKAPSFQTPVAAPLVAKRPVGRPKKDRSSSQGSQIPKQKRGYKRKQPNKPGNFPGQEGGNNVTKRSDVENKQFFYPEEDLETDSSGSEETFHKRQLSENISQKSDFDIIWTMGNENFLLKIVRGVNSLEELRPPPPPFVPPIAKKVKPKASLKSSPNFSKSTPSINSQATSVTAIRSYNSSLNSPMKKFSIMPPHENFRQGSKGIKMKNMPLKRLIVKKNLQKTGMANKMVNMSNLSNSNSYMPMGVEQKKTSPVGKASTSSLLTKTNKLTNQSQNQKQQMKPTIEPINKNMVVNKSHHPQNSSPRPSSSTATLGLDSSDKQSFNQVGRPGKTGKKSGSSSSAAGGKTKKTAEAEKVYCYCQSPHDNVSQMIGCDAKDCYYQWFHFECVSITIPPRGKWYCPDCRKK